MRTHLTPDQRVATVAEGQAGCVSRAQALDAGVSDSMIRHRLDQGRWRRCHPGVYRIEGSPASWRQDIWLAVLAAGPPVAISHETALLLHGVPETQLPRYPIVLTVPRGHHHRIRGTRVHQVDDLADSHVAKLDGLVVSRPERAILEMASRLKLPHQLGILLDQLIVDRRTTIARVGACLTDVARRGKPGVALLSRVLEERGPGYVPPGSELEARLLAALTRAGLPEPVRQIQLPGRGAIEGIADAGYADARLLLEADGRRWHTRLTDRLRDSQRDAEASRAGWLTLRFLYEQITQEPDEVASAVAETRAIRLQQFNHQRAA